jgi:hypothetical protein
VPHPDTISWAGYWYNLGLATLGNIIGGAVFVAGLYWISSPEVREQVQPDASSPARNGTPIAAAPEPALSVR